MKYKLLSLILAGLLAACALSGCSNNQKEDTVSTTTSTTSSMLEGDDLVTPAESEEVVSSETVTNEDGSTTTTETMADGSVVTTTTASDGSVTQTEKATDGTVIQTQTAVDGTVTRTQTASNGTQTVTTTPPSTTVQQPAAPSGGGSTTTPPSTGTTTTPPVTSTPSTPTTSTPATTPSTPSQSTSTPSTSTPTPPVYVTADADDAAAVAARALEYINQWRAEEGKSALVALPNATAYTNIRAQQLITNFAHDANDAVAAATQLKYGLYVDESNVNSIFIYGYTGSIPYYYPSGNYEVITQFGWVSDSTTLQGDIDQVALHMATNWKNSSGHWAALSSSSAHYIGISASYQGNCWRGVAITLPDATYG